MKSERKKNKVKTKRKKERQKEKCSFEPSGVRITKKRNKTTTKKKSPPPRKKQTNKKQVSYASASYLKRLERINSINADVFFLTLSSQ